MARYISRSQAFKKGVVKAQTDSLRTAQGQTVQVETRKPIIAMFQQGGATPVEIQAALERFKFTGTYEGENVGRRISIYDTDEQAREHGWPDELKAEIEAVLDRDQGQNYFRAETATAPMPWPSYDETPAAKVPELAKTIGVPFETVLAYEREHENRPAVVKRLEATEVVNA